MTALQQLLGARAMLTPAGAWLPGVSFRAADAAGRPVACRADEAVRWGVLGALVRLGPYSDERLDAVLWLRRAVGAKHLCTWEEESGRTQDEVLGALDAAIDLARDGDRP